MIKSLPLSIILAVIVLTFYATDFFFMLLYDPQRNKKAKDGRGITLS